MPGIAASPSHHLTHPHIRTLSHPHIRTIKQLIIEPATTAATTVKPPPPLRSARRRLCSRRSSSAVVRRPSSVIRLLADCLPTLARTSVSQQHRTPHTSTPAHHRRCDELLVTVKSVTIISLSLRLCCACGHLCPCLSDGCCSFKQWCGSW